MTGRLQIKNGFFYLRINYKDESGKYRDKWIHTHLTERGNKRKAEEMLRNYLNEYGENPKKFLKSLTMPELIEKWLIVKKEEVRPNTFTSYSDTAKMHVIPYFEALGLSVQQLEPVHVQDYYLSKMTAGLSSGTLTRHRTIIHDSLDYALQILGIIKFNPADRVKLPKMKDKRLPSFYSEEQLHTLFEAVKGESIETPVLLSATYGFRRSEALGLKWSAVDWGRKTISIYHTVIRNGADVIYRDTVKRNASYRTMPLTEDMEQYLLELKVHQEQMKELYGNCYHDNDYICKWDDGKPLDPDYVTGRFNRFLKAKELPHIRFHDLRHSSASLLINNGFTLKEVQEWLGQADIASTEIYAHLLYKSKESMAEKVNAALRKQSDGDSEIKSMKSTFSENSETNSEKTEFSA